MKYCLIIVLTGMLFGSCLKDKAYIDVSNTQPIIEFSYGSNGSSTIGNFGVNPTITELDTLIGMNIASPQVLDYPVTVTLKVDTSYITSFNGQGGVQLKPLPDSIYRLDSTTIVIPAGHRIGKIPITLFPSKLDPVTSYGLPVSIVSAKGPSGQNLIVSGNSGVAYYAFIGNPIAGSYEQEWIRYNATDTTGTPYMDKDEGPTLFTAVDPTTIEVSSGTGVTYIVSFTNTNGVLSDFQVAFPTDANDPGSPAHNSITITSGPKVLVANPTTGIFRFYFTYNNSAGAARVIMDQFIKL